MSSLRELGLLSARYAEEEATKQRNLLLASVSSLVESNSSLSSSVKTSTTTSTIVSAPIPVQKVSSSSSSSSYSLPGSPVFVQSPPTPNITSENSNSAITANLLPLLAAQQRVSIPGGIDKLQPLNLGFLPLTNPFASLTAPQGLLMPTTFPSVRTVVPPFPATMLTTAQQLPPPAQFTPSVAPAPSVEMFSSLSASRVRKPFHKRRPAHMDKNMLFCHFCGRKETPEWRKGPSGPATLCNACGLQWAKKVRAQRSSPSTSKTSAKNTSKITSSESSEATSSDVEVPKADN